MLSWRLTVFARRIRHGQTYLWGFYYNFTNYMFTNKHIECHPSGKILFRWQATMFLFFWNYSWRSCSKIPIWRLAGQPGWVGPPPRAVRRGRHQQRGGGRLSNNHPIIVLHYIIVYYIVLNRIISYYMYIYIYIYIYMGGFHLHTHTHTHCTQSTHTSTLAASVSRPLILGCPLLGRARTVHNN